MTSYSDDAFQCLGVTHVAIAEMKLVPIARKMKEQFKHNYVYTMYPETSHAIDQVPDFQQYMWRTDNFH